MLTSRKDEHYYAILRTALSLLADNLRQRSSTLSKGLRKSSFLDLAGKIDERISEISNRGIPPLCEVSPEDLRRAIACNEEYIEWLAKCLDDTHDMRLVAQISHDVLETEWLESCLRLLDPG